MRVNRSFCGKQWHVLTGIITFGCSGTKDKHNKSYKLLNLSTEHYVNYYFVGKL